MPSTEVHSLTSIHLAASFHAYPSIQPQSLHLHPTTLPLHHLRRSLNSRSSSQARPPLHSLLTDQTQTSELDRTEGGLADVGGEGCEEEEGWEELIDLGRGRPRDISHLAGMGGIA